MRLPILFLLLTVMIDSMGIGLILPVMPELIEEVTGGTLAQAALWGGLLSTVFALMQFLFGPMLGSLSDRFGRRPILLTALGVMAIDYVIMALAGSIWLLLIGRIVAGITAATQTAASAAIADLSDPKKKAQNFGLVGAAIGLGFVLGPLLGGFLGGFGTRAPFIAAAVLAGMNMVLGYFVLPETVTDAIRRPIERSRLNPLGAFKALNRMDGVARGIAVFFLLQTAFHVYPSIWSYFGTERFGWDAGLIGLSLTIFGLSVAIVQAVLIRYILKYLGERGTVIYGLTFNMIAFLAISFVTSGHIALILTPLAAMGAVTSPAIQGMLSQRVGDNEQGALQGVFLSAAALAAIASPPLMTTIFFSFTHEGAALYFPGAPFIASIVILLAAFAVLFWPQRREQTII
ncbi:MAG: MFS transporter [Pseudomonadota bacterium]|nr:MFS transporter [Pseudomonadota bacterium]